MKINFTKKEYVKLLDVLYIADWIMNAFHSEERVETKEYKDLEQNLFRFAKTFGVDDLITLDSGGGEFMPTKEFEEESPALEFIEEYEVESFWDELIGQLAKRDLILKHGPQIMKLVFEDEDINRELETLEEKYAQEFKENGLSNLRLS
ncbi:MAG TPA: hypothetical protein VFC84_00850 [Desulfosporosinus sp.]|nr:hypothetical protein [Desulfosporosinus sp.]